MAARPVIGQLKKSKGWSVWLSYDWIVNKGIYSWPMSDDRVDFGDGANSIEFFVYINRRRAEDDSILHPHPFTLHQPVPDDWISQVFVGEDHERYRYGMPVGTEEEIKRLEQKYVDVSYNEHKGLS